MKILSSLAVALLLAAPAAAQEAVALTVAKTFPTPPAISSYGPGSLLIEVVPTKRIVIRLVANGDLQDPFVYPCPPTTPPEKPNECTTNTPAEMDALIAVVNTGNHTVTSLWRKILTRLIADFPSRFPGGAVVQ